MRFSPLDSSKDFIGVVSVLLYLLQFPSYDVINAVIGLMSDADCTPGREPRSVAASFFVCHSNISGTAERICATVTVKTCFVRRSDKFECQGQRS